MAHYDMHRFNVDLAVKINNNILGFDPNLRENGMIADY